MNFDKKMVSIVLLAVLLALVFLFFLLTNNGTANVTTAPDGATVYVDGRKKSEAPLKVKRLKLGDHTFVAKKDGFLDSTVTVKIKRGKNDVKLELSPTISAKLPYRGDNFYIDYSKDDKGNPKYKITLFAIINRPSQHDSYIAQLKTYKKQALDWLKSNNIDVEKSQLEYLPPIAKNL